MAGETKTPSKMSDAQREFFFNRMEAEEAGIEEPDLEEIWGPQGEPFRYSERGTPQPEPGMGALPQRPREGGSRPPQGPPGEVGPDGSTEDRGLPSRMLKHVRGVGRFAADAAGSGYSEMDARQILASTGNYDPSPTEISTLAALLRADHTNDSSALVRGGPKIGELLGYGLAFGASPVGATVGAAAGALKGGMANRAAAAGLEATANTGAGAGALAGMGGMVPRKVTDAGQFLTKHMTNTSPVGALAGAAGKVGSRMLSPTGKNIATSKTLGYTGRRLSAAEPDIIDKTQKVHQASARREALSNQLEELKRAEKLRVKGAEGGVQAARGPLLDHMGATKLAKKGGKANEARVVSSTAHDLTVAEQDLAQRTIEATREKLIAQGNLVEHQGTQAVVKAGGRANKTRSKAMRENTALASENAAARIKSMGDDVTEQASLSVANENKVLAELKADRDRASKALRDEVQRKNDAARNAPKDAKPPAGPTRAEKALQLKIDNFDNAINSVKVRIKDTMHSGLEGSAAMRSVHQKASESARNVGSSIPAQAGDIRRAELDVPAALNEGMLKRNVSRAELNKLPPKEQAETLARMRKQLSREKMGKKKGAAKRAESEVHMTAKEVQLEKDLQMAKSNRLPSKEHLKKRGELETSESAAKRAETSAKGDAQNAASRRAKDASTWKNLEGDRYGNPTVGDAAEKIYSASQGVFAPIREVKRQVAKIARSSWPKFARALDKYKTASWRPNALRKSREWSPSPGDTLKPAWKKSVEKGRRGGLGKAWDKSLSAQSRVKSGHAAMETAAKVAVDKYSMSEIEGRIKEMGEKLDIDEMAKMYLGNEEFKKIVDDEMKKGEARSRMTGLQKLKGGK